MKAKFKFNVGQKVTAQGFTAPIAMCAVTSSGIQYLIRNDYAEIWAPEKEVKPAGDTTPDETE